MSRAPPSPVVPHLLREQANALQLYLQYKGYHWNVAGPLFRELHLMFDEHATLVFEMIDPLAERQRMLGAVAMYTAADLAVAATLPPDTTLPGTPGAMVERLIAGHRTIIEGMHEGFRAAELAQDPGSADLFTRCVQSHEKMEWFLREMVVPTPPMPDETGLRAPSSEPSATLRPSPGPRSPAPGPGRK